MTNSTLIGKQGEALFKQVMSASYIVEDVSNCSAYWDKDIDFLLTNPRTGNTRSFEVKNDCRIAETGNLYLELTNVHSKGGLGWYRFTQADFLAYCDNHSHTIYIIPMDQLRAKLKDMQRRIAYCGNDSSGWVVKLSEIQKHINITIL